MACLVFVFYYLLHLLIVIMVRMALGRLLELTNREITVMYRVSWVALHKLVMVTLVKYFKVNHGVLCVLNIVVI